MIANYTRTPDVLAVRKEGPFKTLPEFVDYARKNPKKVSVAVPGDAHKLAVILIEQSLGIDLNPVMFKSGSEAMNTLMGGHVMAVVCASQFAVGSASKGVITLALTGEKRVDAFPQVPTFKDLGHDVPIEMMRIFSLPKGVPAPIMQKLATTLAALDKDPDFVEKVKASGEVYGALFGADLENYYRETNVKITKTVEKFKDQFAE